MQQAVAAGAPVGAGDPPDFARAFERSTVLAVAAYDGDPMRLGGPGRPVGSIGQPEKRCPTFPVSDVRRYRLRTPFEPKRALELDMIVARLPPALDVTGAIMAVAAKRFGDGGCILSKSGLSLVQMDEFLIAFPTVCQDVYPYKKALPIVLGELQRRFGARFPKRFIFGPCGQMVPRLVSVDAYLAGRAR